MSKRRLVNVLIAVWGLVACYSLIPSESVRGAPLPCDNDCRQVWVTVQADPNTNKALTATCARYKYSDCRPCVDEGGCSTLLPKLGGACKDDTTVTQKSATVNCSIQCDPPYVALRKYEAHSNDTPKDADYIATAQGRKVCPDAGGS